MRVAVLRAVEAMKDGAAGIGRAAAALSIDVSRCDASASAPPCSGRGMPTGGIMPPRTLRMTFSQTSAPAGRSDSVDACRARVRRFSRAGCGR